MIRCCCGEEIDETLDSAAHAFCRFDSAAPPTIPPSEAFLNEPPTDPQLVLDGLFEDALHAQ